ncbi:hypothetical protein EV426DRAFT_699286 [Tirmania nivea]|nr:hypothetical protein EV426DRAFT_699286 [Tirmania nivea]
MCLIHVRRKTEDEEVIPPRLTNGRTVHRGTTTTVITPIPPPPPPPPPETAYSNALVATTNHHGQGNYVYDVGSESLVEAEYRNADGYTYDADADRHSRHRDYRASGGDYVYSIHGGASGAHGGSQYDSHDRENKVTTRTFKGSIMRSHSEAGRSRSHSRSRSYSGVVRAASTSKTSKPDIVIGPGGETYVKTHRHRHRRRSGSIEREKSVIHFSHIDSPEARLAVSGRRSNVSISNGRMSGVEMSEPRSSFRYIEPRGSARGLESAEMVRRREEERFAYGGLNPHRRSGSVSYVTAEAYTGGHRSFSGSSRKSREKVIIMDRDYH